MLLLFILWLWCGSSIERLDSSDFFTRQAEQKSLYHTAKGEVVGHIGMWHPSPEVRMRSKMLQYYLTDSKVIHWKAYLVYASSIPLTLQEAAWWAGHLDVLQNVGLATGIVSESDSSITLAFSWAWTDSIEKIICDWVQYRKNRYASRLLESAITNLLRI